MARKPPVIVLGHELGTEDGITFVCTEFGMVREFDSIAAAQAHLEKYMPLAQRGIWSVYVIAEIVPAPWKDDDGA